MKSGERMREADAITIVNELLRASEESPCVEFNESSASPTMIGECASALANRAALSDPSCGYVVWGIRNDTRAVVGTQFDPDRTQVEQQPLEQWLEQRLAPRLPISFETVDHPDGRVVVLKIPAAAINPVEFERVAYLRVGSATDRLVDHPDDRRRLWARLQAEPWESEATARALTGDEVLVRLAYPKYFELTQQRLPDDRTGIFKHLTRDRLIVKEAGEHWSITNLGAILFANRLDHFDFRLARRAVRFAAYAGNGRADRVTHRRDWERGYAVVFSDLVEYVNAMVPTNEFIGLAIRTEHRPFSEIAVRELIANALMHQDMTVTGAGPLIELFTNRIEITNAGAPLMEPERIIGTEPRWRNEALVALMRRMRLCKGTGSGIERVVAEVESCLAPPLDFQVYPRPGATRAVLSAPRKFKDMTSEERVHACYQHAVLRHSIGETMCNATFRERLGLDAKSSGQVSSVIGAARQRGWIKPADPDHPRAGYVPSGV